MQLWTKKPRPERAQSEQALLEPPLPHGGGLPPGLFANRPFIWLVLHMGVSQLGFWAFFVAVLGQASYQHGAGPFQLGILFSTFSVAFLSFTALFGMVTDRWSPRWLVAMAQLVSIGAVVVAMLGNSLEWLYVSSMIDGVGAAMAIPARGSLTGLLVEERSLVRANGMLHTASMLAVIVGPGVSGLVIQRGGDDAVYWLIIAVLVAGLLPVLLIPDRRPGRADEPGFLSDLVEGFKVSWREPELRSLLLLGGAAWFLLTVLVTLEPLFVKDVLGRGVDSLGLLWSAHGVGAFAGAIAVSRSRRAGGREVWFLGLSLVVGGVGFLTYVATSWFAVAVAGTVLFGLSFAWFLSLSQALIQRVAAENLRGRVTGVVGMLQESTALVCSASIAALGGLIVAVQPYLVASALLLTGSGLYGLRAGRRTRRAGTQLSTSVSEPGARTTPDREIGYRASVDARVGAGSTGEDFERGSAPAHSSGVLEEG
jgi:predicted MFS family arabinose efflux permease